MRELLRRDPFDEEVARALMIALFRLGRQKDAIQVGRDVSERFAQAGMDPSPRLRDIHVRILRGDTELGVTPAYRGSPRAGQPNTLPPEDPDFVGRAEETTLLTAECDSNTPLLAVVVGAAGVGKTTLAVRVAHRMAARYPDAQLFLPFPGDGPGAVAEALDRLLRMLGVPAARIPAGTGERARLWRAEMAQPAGGYRAGRRARRRPGDADRARRRRLADAGHIAAARRLARATRAAPGAPGGG